MVKCRQMKRHLTAGLTCTSRRQQPQLSRAPQGRGPVTDLELGLNVADASADGVLEKDSSLAISGLEVSRKISQHPELARSRLRLLSRLDSRFEVLDFKHPLEKLPSEYFRTNIAITTTGVFPPPRR